MKLDQTKRLRELEKENGRLKRLVADLAWENGYVESFNSRMRAEF